MGVLLAPGAEERSTLSVQHSEEDVQHYVDNFSEMAPSPEGGRLVPADELVMFLHTDLSAITRGRAFALTELAERLPVPADLERAEQPDG